MMSCSGVLNFLAAAHAAVQLSACSKAVCLFFSLLSGFACFFAQTMPVVIWNISSQTPFRDFATFLSQPTGGIVDPQCVSHTHTHTHTSMSNNKTIISAVLGHFHTHTRVQLLTRVLPRRSCRSTRVAAPPSVILRSTTVSVHKCFLYAPPNPLPPGFPRSQINLECL